MEGLAPLGSTPLYHTKQPRGQKHMLKKAYKAGEPCLSFADTPLIVLQLVKHVVVGLDDPIKERTLSIVIITTQTLPTSYTK